MFLNREDDMGTAAARRKYRQTAQNPALLPDGEVRGDEPFPEVPGGTRALESLPAAPKRPLVQIAGLGTLSLLKKAELDRGGIPTQDVVGLSQGCGHPITWVYVKSAGVIGLLCRECKRGSAIRVALDG
jgi:hypothetical protein